MTYKPKFTVISPESCAGKSWLRLPNYTFAAGDTLIPMAAAELIRAVPAMPLGFMQSGDSFELVAVTSMKPGGNWFVAPDGRWLGGYVPAALRTYPFKLIKLPDRPESVLCIDEASGLFVDAGQGEPFFEEDGELNKVLKELLGILSQIEQSRAATRAAVNTLAAAKVLQPWPINIKQDDKTISVSGLYRIDEASLNALADDAFLTLRRTGALPVAYAQLLSMNQLAVLQRLLQQRNAAKAPAAAPTAAASGDFKGIKGIGLSQDDGILKFG